MAHIIIEVIAIVIEVIVVVIAYVKVEVMVIVVMIMTSSSRALIGEVDENLDSRLDLENIRAEPLNECKT